MPSDASTVIPVGELNIATTPTPFATSATPEPANELATPNEVTFRILLFPESAT